ncbi:hypothetical protein DN752_11710 [Echinicola strongylocentroti]|uniref:Uncharacterized protein n=1 Tax=Echinicola strongylocentroti TaxID=1795355 RepID=A0A2Z4IIK7_9BACT|nr:hypothetical protein [Echinicola strongylocentroti]AWW30735.1 hypothetical protein DN752_11710 [Echinicola strongylocentroti]
MTPISTAQFRIEGQELVLLRKGFPYKRIVLREIDKVEFTKGSKVNNPLLLGFFGIALLSMAIYSASTVLEISQGFISGYDNFKNTGSIMRVLFVWLIMFGLLGFIGIFSLYEAFWPVRILKVNAGKKRYVFELKKTDENGQYKSLIKVFRQSIAVDGIIIYSPQIP